MELTLIAVTLLSLGMAVAMGVVTWRLLREERRRSAARVARLAELAARDDSELAGRVAPRPLTRPKREDAVDPLDRPLRRTAPIVDAPGAAETVPMRDELFAQAEPPSGGRRGLVLAVALVLVAAGVATFVSLGGARRTTDRPATAGPIAPLELLSLGHTRQDETLTIAGLVRNPTDGGELRHVIAVAFVFDQSGELIGSGRGALEFFRLAPGAESPFVITINNAGSVGRYRVGFRTEDGSVVGHVDRRSAVGLAQPERASAAAPAGRVTTADALR